MRRKKCLFLVLFLGVLSLFLPSTLLVKNVSAQNLYDAIAINVSSASLRSLFNTYNGTIDSTTGGFGFTRSTTSGNVDYAKQLSFCRTQNFPKNVLVYFTLKSSTRVPVVLASGSANYSIQAISYGEYGDVTYAVYLDHSTNEYNCLSFYVDDYEMPDGAWLSVSRVTGIILQDGPTLAQISTIATDVSDVISNLTDLNATQLDILNAINGLSFSGITGAINSQSQQQHADSQAEQQKLDDIGNQIEEQNDKDDQDRSDISDQQTDIDSDAQDSSDDASDTGTTLLVAFTGFVNNFVYAVSHPNSNCRILMDMGNLNLGYVDLCSLSLPEPLQALSSIFLVLFCVPLSIATARKLISLIRSFQK